MKNIWNILLVLVFIITFTPITVNAKMGSNKRLEIKKDAAKVTNRGVILLNKKIVQKYLREFKFIRVNYNYGTNLLTLKPVNKPGINVVPIILTRKDKIAVIIQKNLLKNSGANISSGNYYQCTWDNVEKMIVIDYSSPTTRKNLEKENAKEK